jgi:segregation and condensation protein B
MDYFGINTTADLPKIREVLAEQMIEGTLINPDDFTSNTELPFQEETIIEEETVIAITEEVEVFEKKDEEHQAEETSTQE